MSDDDYNPYLPDGPGSRMDSKGGPGLADFLPDVSGGYKATAGAALAGAAGPADCEIVEAALKTVHDPEIPVNIYDLGLIYNVDINQDTKQVTIDMTLTAPGCGMGPVLVGDVEYRVGLVPFVEEVKVELVFDPPWSRDKMSEEAQLEAGLFF